MCGNTRAHPYPGSKTSAHRHADFQIFSLRSPSRTITQMRSSPRKCPARGPVSQWGLACMRHKPRGSQRTQAACGPSPSPAMLGGVSRSLSPGARLTHPQSKEARQARGACLSSCTPPHPLCPAWLTVPRHGHPHQPSCCSVWQSSLPLPIPVHLSATRMGFLEHTPGLALQTLVLLAGSWSSFLYSYSP